MTCYFFCILFLTMCNFLLADSTQSENKTSNGSITVRVDGGKYEKKGSNESIRIEMKGAKGQTNGTKDFNVTTRSSYGYNQCQGRLSSKITVEIGPQRMNGNCEVYLRPIRVTIREGRASSEFIGSRKDLFDWKKDYCISNTRVNWYEGWLSCNSESRRFATIRNFEDQEIIKNSIHRELRDLYGEVWIGGHELANRFAFISACEPMTFFNWKTTPASDSSSFKRCITLSKDSDFKWEAKPCNEKHFFACEC